MALTKVLALVDGEPQEIEIDLPDPPAIPVRRVRKSVVVERIIAAGLAQKALTALNANPVARMRFDAASDIAADDATFRALLTGIGGDPAALLAP